MDNSGGLEGPRGAGLWIKLWIRGVKSVDKVVDNSVDNPGLWITRELSTITGIRDLSTDSSTGAGAVFWLR